MKDQWEVARDTKVILTVPPRSAIAVRTEKHVHSAVVWNQRTLRDGGDTIIPRSLVLEQTMGVDSGTFIVQIIPDLDQDPRWISH